MAGPVLGPCAAWITGSDIASCCPQAAGSSVDPAVLDELAVEASMQLYELSGRQFSGACEETVRPCRSPCSAMLGPGWQWGSWYTGPGWSNPAWGWWLDQEASCGCGSLPTIDLVYPVASVSEVKIGGVAVDSDTYRVDEYRYLVRLWDDSVSPPRALRWPACQNLGLPDTDAGTFSVKYTHGVAPPPLGARAAAQLGCQLYLACFNQAACTLPTGASRVSRQGITIDRGVLANWFRVTRFGKGWATGLPAIDAFLTAYNPNALRRRPAVFSPDVQPYPRRVGT